IRGPAAGGDIGVGVLDVIFELPAEERDRSARRRCRGYDRVHDEVLEHVGQVFPALAVGIRDVRTGVGDVRHLAQAGKALPGMRDELFLIELTLNVVSTRRSGRWEVDPINSIDWDGRS